MEVQINFMNIFGAKSGDKLFNYQHFKYLSARPFFATIHPPNQIKDTRFSPSHTLNIGFEGLESIEDFPILGI
jgi:hypothetical protein